MNLIHLLAPVFEWVLRATWSAAILIALVLALQWLLRDKLAPRWRYALWLIVAVRLGIPFSPESAISVFNIANVRAAKQASSTLSSVEVSATPEGASSQGSAITPRSPRRPPRWGEMMAEETELQFELAGAARGVKTPSAVYWGGLAVWASVALFLLVRSVLQNARFLLQVRKSVRVEERATRALFLECRETAGVRRSVELLRVDGIHSPALYGIFHLRLLLPGDFRERFTRAELRHIFLHELAHVKRWDSVINGAVAILEVVHWFNPLVQFGFRKMSLDRELACDEMAMSWLKAGENQAYGETILKLLQPTSQPRPIFTGVGILEDYRQLLSRMRCIGRFGTPRARPILAIGLVGIVGLVSLTDAKSKSGTDLDAVASPRESVTRTLRLTGNEANGLLSPDESKLVFNVWHDSGADLYVKDLGTLETRKLTNTGTNWFFAETFVWSPDSKQIAYTWYKDEADEIRIALVDGREDRLILAVPWTEDSYPYLIDWSRDGERLLFERHTKGYLSGMAILDIRSKEIQKVGSDFDPKPKLPISTHGRFSPNVDYIVFQQNLREQAAIFTIQISDGRTKQITDPAPRGSNPVWASDGRYVLFSSIREGKWALWSVSVEDGMRAGAPFRVRSHVRDYAKRMSADGHLIYYSTPDEDGDHYLIVVKPDTGEVSSPRLLLSLEGEVLNGAKPINDNRLVYFRNTTVYIRSPDGLDQKVETPFKHVDSFQLVDGGRSIVVEGIDSKNQSGFFALNLKKGIAEAVLLSHEGYSFRGESVDSGEWILAKGQVMQANEQEGLLKAVDPRTKKVRELHTPKTRGPLYGPYGFSAALRKIVYIERDQDSKEDRMMSFNCETGETRKLFGVAHPQTLVAPKWVSDAVGQHQQVVYFQMNQDRAKVLRLYRLEDESHKTILTEGPDFDSFIRPNFSPDGTMMAFVNRGDEKDEMVILSLDGRWRKKIQLNARARRPFAGTWFPDSTALKIQLTNKPRLEIGIVGTLDLERDGIR